MLFFLSIILLIIISGIIFMQQSKFGKISSGQRLERIKNSPNYKDGRFQNSNFTPDLAEGVSYYKVIKEFLFDKSKRISPVDTLPSKKIDLHTLDADQNIFVWFGHSSYFMQIDGKKILVDPVMSGAASPISFTTKSFRGSDVYTTDDIPEIDYLFITHDHWDHLDYETILKLKPKIKKIITGLGTPAHLEHWGYDKNIIIEKDWDEEIILEKGFVVNTVSARHFSGRGLKRNQALWMTFVLKTPTMKILIGGDSGYDTHFKNIGDQHGPFDFAILECGQYHHNWKYIHMMPEELIIAAEDLRAKKIIPVHWAKFALAQHAWDEPIIRVTAEAKRKNVSIIHPIIGEGVTLNNDFISSEWWRDIR